MQLAKSFPNAVNAVAAAHRHENAVRRTSELLHDLESNGLEAFDAERVAVARTRAKNRTGESIAARHQFLQAAFLVATPDGACAEHLHEAQLRFGGLLVAENRGFEPCCRGVGGKGAAMISRADRGDMAKSEVSRDGNGNAVGPVLPRPGGTLRFILQQHARSGGHPA